MWLTDIHLLLILIRRMAAMVRRNTSFRGKMFAVQNSSQIKFS